MNVTSNEWAKQDQRNALGLYEYYKTERIPYMHKLHGAQHRYRQYGINVYKKVGHDIFLYNKLTNPEYRKSRSSLNNDKRKRPRHIWMSIADEWKVSKFMNALPYSKRCTYFLY